MTKEEQEATIKALLAERRGYEMRAATAEREGDSESQAALTARVAQVDAQLKHLGSSAQKPASRAERRPAEPRSSER